MATKTHIMSDETGQRMAKALEAIAGQTALEWDEDSGEYTRQSIVGFLNSIRNGLCYGVSIPKGSATACTKTGANAGISAPTLSTASSPGLDPYRGIGPFWYMEVNGKVDADGTPHVTGISGDGRFRRDGANGNVWIMTPVLWWSYDSSTSSSVTITVSDTKQAGLSAQPHAYLPDGNIRPYMLYAKYALGVDADGNAISASGYRAKNRSVSHDTLINLCKNASSGYSGKSIADDWYMKVMLLLKYATKNSQSIFAGCTSYDVQCTPTVAETGVTRVIVSNSDAANLLVGSAVMLGTGAKGVDRGASNAFDVFDALKIKSITTYDSSNKAINIDTPTAFNTTTTGCLQTAPWFSGACDGIEGDGSPTSPTSGKEPFVLQGIEVAVGLYEVLGDVIMSSDGSTGWKIYVNHDSKAEATSVTSAYSSTGIALPADSSDGWKYPLYPGNADGLIVGQGSGASTTTGMCDGIYANSIMTTGTREWLSLGNLGLGGNAGVFCVNGNPGLGNAWWYIGSRLSATGRSRG